MRTALIALAALVALTACGGDGDGDEGDVIDAAQDQVDYFASQDYAGAYDMWVDDAKELISRDDYVRFAEACDLGGMPLDVEFVRFESDDEAVVKVGVGKFMYSYAMRHEGKEWRWVPDVKAQAAYRLGVDAAIAQECSA